MHETTARLYQAAAELRRIYHLPDLAHALMVSAQTVRNWEKNGLSKKGLQEACQIFGLSLEWLQTGQGDMLDNPTPITLTPPSLVERPRPNTHTPPVDLHEFALQQLGFQAAHIVYQVVQNDNMFNTLAIGDTVLVDIRVQAYMGSGVYALETAAGVRIYRINQFQNGFFVLINDNPAYPPEIIRPEEMGSLKMLGRVVGKYGVVAL